MRRLWKRENTGYYVVYTLIFALMIPIVFFLLFSNGKGLVWKGDGFRQHYVALSYFGRWGRELLKNIFLRHTFEIPLWDFHVGYGSDILTTFHYYAIGDPLSLLSIAVPARYTEYLYGALIILRMYLSGIAFSYYCFDRKKGKRAVLAGTLCYAFCGAVTYGATCHPFFINAMIYLPFLLVGAERIFARKKPALFVFMVFLSAVSNFYFFYMTVFAVCFYVCVRFFMMEHEHMGKELLVVIGRFFCYACIGVFMSAVILLPILLQFTQTSRISAESDLPILYNDIFYREFITKFMVSGTMMKRTNLGFTAPALFAVFVLFGKRRQHAALKVSFLIMTAMLWIPFFGKALNGFSYVTNRWSWIYAALISYILATVWEDMLTLKNTSVVVVAAECLLYLAYFFAKAPKGYIFIFGWLLLFVLLLSLFGRRFYGREEVIRAVSCVLICVSLFQIGLNWNGIFNGSGKNRMEKYLDSGTAWEKTLASPPYAMRRVSSEDERFFRYEMDDFSVCKNTAALAGTNGVQFYWSLENGQISKYLKDMAISRFYPFNYRGLEYRTFLDELAGVKYFVQKRSKVMPFGYEYQETVSLGSKEYHIYENQYALPIGYTYSSYIPYASWQDMKPVQRQEALLQGVVLEGEFQEGKLREAKPVFSSRSLEYKAECQENVRRQADGSFQVEKNGSRVKLAFSAPKNCELYLWVQGADMKSKRCNEFEIKVLSDSSKSMFRYITKRHRLYSGQKDFLVNLGYSEKEQTSITIRFPKKGSYRFDDLQVICQPMENYVRQAEALREYTMENEKITANRVEGTVHLPQKRILCLSIPYTKGWSAYVDGEKTPLLKANIMYMALPLEEGEHKITLSYRTPGLYPGILLSFMGFVLFGFIIWYGRRKDKKETV